MAAHGGALKLAMNILSRVSSAPAAYPSVETEPLLSGFAGTYQTLESMARAVRGEIAPDYSGWADLYNQQTASSIVNGGGNQLAALLAFTRDQIQYVNHPWNMQVVKDCRRTLESKSGDCVSKSVCLATLLACRGIVSRFVAQAPDGENHDHVYLQAQIDGQWVSLDPTADGKDGRPLGGIGWSQTLPVGGAETPHSIFF